MRSRRLIGWCVATVVGACMTWGSPPAGAEPLSAQVLPEARFPTPPTTAECERRAGIACYSPRQFQAAYDMSGPYRRGLSGAGVTIAVVDSFGSPTIAADLATFDRSFGLPAPPSFRIVRPSGAIPRFTSRSTTMTDWAVETSLDVEYAHALAPGANIVLAETPTAETIGTAGFPQIVRAENYVIDHHLADVISQSFGAAEPTFATPSALLRLRGAYRNALAQHVTVVAGSGDNGRTDARSLSGALFTRHVADWPASDPLVTSVGGTQVHLDALGNRTAADDVFNDTALNNRSAASGGGVSGIFSRPSYQDPVQPIVGSHRGYPDIAMAASLDGGAVFYTSHSGTGSGYLIGGGTSQAAPMFVGVVAVADQAAGTRLGLLNPALYAAGSGSPAIPDITHGDNAVHFRQGGRSHHIPGSTAVPGYDLASGLGTIDGAQLIQRLAQRTPTAGR